MRQLRARDVPAFKREESVGCVNFVLKIVYDISSGRVADFFRRKLRTADVTR